MTITGSDEYCFLILIGFSYVLFHVTLKNHAVRNTGQSERGYLKEESESEEAKVL